MTSLPTTSTRLLHHARQFLSDMASDPRHHLTQDQVERRLTEIAMEVAASGTYVHTPEELAFGVQWAWRSSNRCIGRHLWRSLKVQDCRDVNTLDGVVAALGEHLSTAWNDGQIQSVITVFAPRKPGRPDLPDAVRIENHQLLRYAGFRNVDGSITGDPHSVDFTDGLLARGWQPAERSAHTPLPWSIWLGDEPQPLVDHFASRPECFPEVAIEHPTHPGIRELGLKWYAIPVISEMALVIGGITYPCAPFNGWYMGAEIAARNFCDPQRYDLIGRIGQAMGLDTSHDRTMWKDEALVAINRAVVHSFDQAGIRIGDHHELGAQFEKFCQVEDRAGRTLNGDWSWLTPPVSGSLSPQFHRTFANGVEPHTNFFYQPSPAEDATARKSPSTAVSRPEDPFQLEHHHETPRCPFGFDRLAKVLPFRRQPLNRAGGHN